MSKKIGVFDSGVGGLSVANAIKQAFPELDIVYVEDREHVPYGSRTPEEIYGFVEPIFQNLIEQGCEVIVIACNTVSTTLAPQLRQRFDVPLLAMEPMVKPASELTKTAVIAVCATPTTLGSDRYRLLKDTYAKDITVLQPDCSRWSYMIEHNAIEDEVVAKQVDEVCRAGADVIVLGCTHYHWIEELIRKAAAGRATVIQPEQAVIKQLWRILETLPA
jgi:glutamate racemase